MSEPVETVPDRNLRLFRSEVLPEQPEALCGLVVGDGTVVLNKVEAFDIRVRCIYTLRHGSKDLLGWESSLVFIHRTKNLDAGTRHTETYFALHSEQPRKPLDATRAIVLWRNPVTLKEISISSSALLAAIAAFDRLPHDDSAEAEFQAVWARLKAGAEPYLGVWYRRGKADQRCEVRLTAAGWLHFVRPDVRFDDHRDRTYIAGAVVSDVDRLGRLKVQLQTKPVTLSPDGQRLDIEGYQEWWSREPVGKGRSSVLE